MRRSDIFEDFIKIAQEKGLVSKDAPEKAKKKLESNPRADSMSIKDIEALYGVKPDLPKDMEYDKNIIEDAHPESVVISPSYDKLNGLVENNIERQNIILNIVNKQPNGQLTQHKYAQQDLMLSLVRVGNDLDNHDNDELRILADTCLEQVSAEKKKLIKNAIAPLAIATIIGAAVGALYAWQHLPNEHENFKKDSARLKELILNLLNENVSWGVGIELNDRVKKDLNVLLGYINNFEKIYNSLMPIIEQMQIPKGAKDLLEEDSQLKAAQANKAMNMLNNELNEMRPYLLSIKKNFSNPSYKSQVITDTGILTNVIKKTHLYGGSWDLMADKFEQILNQIPAYLKSIDDTLAVLKMADVKAQDAKQSLLAPITNYLSPSDKAAPVATSETPEVHPSIKQDNEEISKIFGF